MSNITLQNPEKFAAIWPCAAAMRLARFSVQPGCSTAWLATVPASSNRLAARLARITGQLPLSIAGLAASTAWFTHFTAWLVNSAVWLAGSTAPINHPTTRIIRPAMRFSIENRPKLPEIAFFDRSAPSSLPSPPLGEKVVEDRMRGKLHPLHLSSLSRV